MLLEYAAAGYVAYRLAVPLIQAAPNPRRFEEERVRRFREGNVWHYIRRAIFDFVLIGAACLVAWRHADLGLLWLGFAILLLGMAIPAAFAWVVNRISPVPPLDPLEPPTPEHLSTLTRSRVRICLTQAALLLAWLYAWRHLAV
jgi:hypothetical protein